MATYTELKCKFKLRLSTPANVVDLLKRVLIDRDLGHEKELFKSEDVFKPDIDHAFFRAKRWYMLLLSTNWGDIAGGKMYRDKWNWVVDLHTEFVCHEDEIGKFVDFITPFVGGYRKRQYIGWYKNENMEQRINLYILRK